MKREPLPVWVRYRRKFGEAVSYHLWNGTEAEMYALMERAIKEGRRITERQVRRIQGMPPPDPTVEY